MSNIINFLTTTSILMSFIFIPNIAKDMGATNLQIGIVGASYGTLIFFSSYIFGSASDKFGKKFFLHLGLVLSILSFFIQIFAKDVFTLTLTRAFAGLTIGIFTPPLIAYVYETGGSMGRFSSYGSLGWTVGSLIAALAVKVTYLFALSSLFFILAFIFSFHLPSVKTHVIDVPLFPFNVIKRNFRVYLPYFLRHLGASAIWIIFPIYLIEIGANLSWIGILYCINFVSQFIIMRHLDKYRDIGIFRKGLIISSVVFLSYTLVSDYRYIFPLQILLAVSWSFLYVGSLNYLTKRNIEKATSVGILTSIISISGALGPFVGGLLSEVIGHKGVMYFASVMPVAGYLISKIKR